jgi:CRISPR/Cas system-associated exonuclease Cas4 (RecB family)
MAASTEVATGDPAAKPAAAELAAVLPRRISPSAVTAYRQCPRRVWFSHVAKVPRRERPNPVLVVGNAVHAALDKFFGVRPERRTLKLLHSCLRSVWAAHRTPGAFVTREEEAAHGRTGLVLLTRFFETFDTSVRPLARERWVSTRLPNGVELYGKVDRIDGMRACEDGTPSRGPLEVVDYKTGRFVIPSENLPDEPAAQVYLLATADEYGRDVERVRLLYLAEGQEARWEAETEDVEGARDQLVAVTDLMFRDREFEARPGEHCARCPFAHVCPDAGRVEPEELAVPDDILF